jgi:UPF0716 protein FxsA
VLAAMVLLPVLELVLAIAVARRVGPAPTVLALLIISAAGMLVIRRAGREAWLRFTRSAAGEQVPARGPADAGVVLLGGLLLLVPGFLTGLAGALLLLPVTRRPTGRALSAVLRDRVLRPGPGGPVITGEVIEPDRPGERSR